MYRKSGQIGATIISCDLAVHPAAGRDLDSGLHPDRHRHQPDHGGQPRRAGLACAGTAITLQLPTGQGANAVLALTYIPLLIFAGGIAHPRACRTG